MKTKFYLIIFIFSYFLVRVFVWIYLVIRLTRIKRSNRKKNGSVLFLESLPFENAGYYYRSKKWAEVFCSNGYIARVKTIFKDKIFYEKLLKFENRPLFLAISLFIRFFQLIKSEKFQFVIVRRELLLYNDYGNLFLEKFLLKIHPDVILDFDDDIAESKGQPKTVFSLFGKLMLENGNKFNESLRLYKKFIVASSYLKERVLKENKSIGSENVLVIPTCVDYDRFDPKRYNPEKELITFGWVGGNQNQVYLEEILPALNNIAKDFSIELIVISGNYFNIEANFPIINIKWDLENEVKNLKRVDVGLMPMPLNKLTKGKGGFKLIQYMGLGLVSVASAITINNEIIINGFNGFLVKPFDDWYPLLKEVLEQKENFANFGLNARKRILESYTFEANKREFQKFVFG